MKKLLFLAVVFGGLSLASCKKDDECYKCTQSVTVATVTTETVVEFCEGDDNGTQTATIAGQSTTTNVPVTGGTTTLEAAGYTCTKK